MVAIINVGSIGIEQNQPVGIRNACGGGHRTHLGAWNVRRRAGIECNGRLVAKEPVIELPLGKPRHAKTPEDSQQDYFFAGGHGDDILPIKITNPGNWLPEG